MKVNMVLYRTDSGEWGISIGDMNVYSMDTGPCESPEAAFGRICKDILKDAREVYFSKYSVEEQTKITDSRVK